MQIASSLIKKNYFLLLFNRIKTIIANINLKIRLKMFTYLITIFLLCASSLIMIVAWYGHLKFANSPLWIAILISWGIAFFEYCLQVPANRIGSGYFSTVQLKTIQEVITLTVFVVFSFLYLGQPVKPNHILGFAIICVGVFVIFKEW